MCQKKDPEYSLEWSKKLEIIQAAIMKYLWDNTNKKFIPHIYLDQGSPFSDLFNENSIYYHGGNFSHIF